MEKGLTKKVTIQKTHRHETPATTRYPATVGPIAGPANGATVKIARAVPRLFASQMSDIKALEEISHENIAIPWNIRYVR
jgi:hypothetical protein